MRCFNFGENYKTKVDSDSIKKDSIITIKKRISYGNGYEGVFQVEDLKGSVAEISSENLMPFGFHKDRKLVFDICSDCIKNNGKEIYEGLIHLSKNVRETKREFVLRDDFLYTDLYDSLIWFDYQFREIDNDEIIQILLDEILYGVQPNLQGSSLVGTSAKGIDKEPNYHDGHYLLPNNKNYTMTWCRGVVKIREGIDGGWYKGQKDVGNQIYEGQIDWKKFQNALINQSCYHFLSNQNIFSELPKVKELIFEHIKGFDKFKLSSDF